MSTPPCTCAACANTACTAARSTTSATQAEAGEAIDCPLFREQTTALIDTLPQLPGHVILVSNEVGWGIVPMHPVSRLFADEQGLLNQRVAAVCDQVTLVAAGLPVTLKAPLASA